MIGWRLSSRIGWTLNQACLSAFSADKVFDAKIFTIEGNDILRGKLFATACLDDTVQQDFAGLDENFGLSTRANDADLLQELIQRQYVRFLF